MYKVAIYLNLSTLSPVGKYPINLVTEGITFLVLQIKIRPFGIRSVISKVKGENQVIKVVR